MDRFVASNKRMGGHMAAHLSRNNSNIIKNSDLGMSRLALSRVFARRSQQNRLASWFSS